MKIKDKSKIEIKAGIYKIQNTKNLKVYVGSAVDLQRRLQHHTYNLNNCTHKNKHLQRAWNKYGEESFIFVPFFSCAPEQCIEWEQYFIDLYLPEYNMCRLANSRLGVKHSPEAIKKIINANKGTEKAAKVFELVNPKGEVVKGKNLAKLARENNLDAGGIRSVLNCKIFQHRGWTRTLENHNILKKYGSFVAYNYYKNLGVKPFLIKNLETAEIHTVYSMQKSQRDLGISNLDKLKVGKIQSCGGWIRIEEELKD